MNHYGKGKKTVLMTFYRKDLLYDIGNLGYITSDVMKTDDAHDRHSISDVAEDGNVDRVTRVMDLAYRECADMLYAYTKTDVEDDRSLDDQFGETDVYEMRLYVPSDFAEGTAVLLKDLIHEYIVQRTLYDWLSLTYRDRNESAMWSLKAEDTRTKIMECMNTRGKRVRRTQTPF